MNNLIFVKKNLDSLPIVNIDNIKKSIESKSKLNEFEVIEIMNILKI